MDLDKLIALTKSFLESMRVLLNAREVIDIIMASLKQYFGKAEEPAAE
jgi:hypothetical protein